MNHKCDVCQRIEQIKNNSNNKFICELENSFVVLGDYQFFKGYTMLIFKKHKTELHQIERVERINYFNEMSTVAEIIYNLFSPKKLNYEILGNLCPHLHWHIFPRYNNDPSPGTTSWEIDKSLRYSEKFIYNADLHLDYKKNILLKLRQKGTKIINAFE